MIMKYLKEALVGFSKEDNKQSTDDHDDNINDVDDPDHDELDDLDAELGLDDETDDVDGDPEDDFSSDVDINDDPDKHDDHEPIPQDSEPEDPNKQGLIRNIKQAHLVYKRQNEAGTFEELWIYNVNNLRDGLETRKRILAGTDIPVTKTSSPDGTETYKIWSVGNAELMLITGLAN